MRGEEVDIPARRGEPGLRDGPLVARNLEGRADEWVFRQDQIAFGCACVLRHVMVVPRLAGLLSDHIPQNYSQIARNLAKRCKIRVDICDPGRGSVRVVNIIRSLTKRGIPTHDLERPAPGRRRSHRNHQRYACRRTGIVGNGEPRGIRSRRAIDIGRVVLS